MFTAIMVVVSIASFLLARQYPTAAWGLMPLYLAGSLAITSYCKSWRIALIALGAIAVGTLLPSIWFFRTMMGAGAVGLWLVMILWQLIPAFTSNRLVQRDDRWEWAVPLIWTAGLVGRCELYSLRFSMATPIDAMVGPSSGCLHMGGYMWTSLMILLLVSVSQIIRHHNSVERRRGYLGVVGGGCLVLVLIPAFLLGSGPSTPKYLGSGPFVVGVQGTSVEPVCTDGKTLLHRPVKALTRALDVALASYPEGELFVLPEYAISGRPPVQIAGWAAEHRKYVVLGGRTHGHNAVFVLNPEGEVEFWQAKVQPVHGLPDGEPAKIQGVWSSPWGAIGLCVCYDLTLSRVVCRLADLGATGIICPAMDLYAWGQQEHEANARFAQIRASELGIPVLRVASSGTSQLVGAGGEITAEAAYPADELQVIGGRMELAKPRENLDRWLFRWLPAPWVRDPL